jgi:hypothetical protein
MLHRKTLVVYLLLMCLAVLGVRVVQAAPVGNFVQVEGTVDILKGGKVPAVPVKVQGGVDIGDLVRTKSDSRAQIKFVDNTVLTIAPESGITIEDYMFDPANNNRKAVVDVLRGMVHTAVEKVNTQTEPDFVMKTTTAVLGVRGTRWYTKILPTATDIYTQEAKLEVRNILPGVPGVQIMRNFQYCRVGMNLPPTPLISITPENLKLLEKQMKSGIGTSFNGTIPGALAGPHWPPLSPQYLGERTQVEYLGSGLYKPPQVIPPVITPTQDFRAHGETIYPSPYPPTEPGNSGGRSGGSETSGGYRSTP